MSELAIYPERGTAALDPRQLLARCDRLAVELRRALAHRHDDDGYWAQLGTTAALAQRRRALVRRLADVLHVIRAAARDRVHGGRRFPDLAAQAAWLAGYERWRSSPVLRTSEHGPGRHAHLLSHVSGATPRAAAPP